MNSSVGGFLYMIGSEIWLWHALSPFLSLSGLQMCSFSLRYNFLQKIPFNTQSFIPYLYTHPLFLKNLKHIWGFLSLQKEDFQVQTRNESDPKTKWKTNSSWLSVKSHAQKRVLSFWRSLQKHFALSEHTDVENSYFCCTDTTCLRQVWILLITCTALGANRPRQSSLP